MQRVSSWLKSPSLALSLTGSLKPLRRRRRTDAKPLRPVSSSSAPSEEEETGLPRQHRRTPPRCGVTWVEGEGEAGEAGEVPLKRE
ncbi:hypothetical protein NHX12_021562 [Muraenolepis orangiensis]|uniref:Uncharacterized protein n=1 Tax=Muraenolepis orangiensis TaxID=630683 RepID=A0A9Q0ISG4_9TELE|nr:hypothetical protein NHX12_021562 [Muraenolepis orangiensis]